MGDFNDEPDSIAIENMEKVMISHLSPKNFIEFEDFTTHKYRESSGMITRTIDYMFTYNQDEL